MSGEAELFPEIKSIARSILQFSDANDSIVLDAPLLGHLPELDSMAVVHILTSIEEYYGIVIEDDEVSADVFSSWRTLTIFVKQKLEE